MSTLRLEHGSFADLSFAMLLIRALDKRWTGLLTLESVEGLTHRMQLDRGLVCRVLVPDGYAQLGHIVVQAGVISDDELVDVLDSHGLLGDALIRARLIDGRTLQRALLLQLLKRLTRVFSFPLETHWEYSPYDNPFEGMPDGVRIDTLRALWAGISVHGEMGSYQDKALERIGASPLRLRRGVNVERFGFSGDAAQLLDDLGGRSTTLRKLIKSNVTPEDVCERVVYLLAITRHLDFTPVGEDVEATLNATSSVEDMPSSEGESISAPVDDGAPAIQRVARIKLRRVALRRGAAPDPAGSGERSSFVAPRGPDGRARRSSNGPAASSSEPARRGASASNRGSAPLSSQTESMAEAEMRSLLQRVDRQSPLETMGLTRAEMIVASERQILDRLWSRYEQMSQRWHPDRCPAERPDLRAGMVKIYASITKAFELLADPDTRAKAMFDAGEEPASSGSRPLSTARPGGTMISASDDPASAKAHDDLHDTWRSSGEQGSESTLNSAASPPPSSGRTARSEAPPSQLHERALMALAEQRLSEALRYCTMASEVAPTNPDYRASSVWIRVAMGQDSAEGLLEELDMLLQTHPEHVPARYYRGVLRRRLRYNAAAQRDFERVLQLEPDHEGARAQVTLLQQSTS